MAAPMDSSEVKRNQRNLSELSKEEYSDSQTELQNKNKKKALILSAVGLSLFMGFGFTMYRIKKRDPVYFQKILKPSMDLPETGVSIASKALAIATVISFTSVGILTWGVFKVLGVKNAHEFHAKLLSYFPPRGPSGRSDFQNLKELVTYLESEDRKAELLKKKNENS